MAEVLVVSKPLVPPWTDGSKGLARDLIRFAENTRFHESPAGWRWKERAVLRLLKPDRVPLAHFFFAPNPRTSRIVNALFRVKRRRAVHTVCSRPVDNVHTWFADVHVALTETTAAELRDAGAPDVRVIAPGIAPEVHETDPIATRRELGLPDGPLVLFAGDLAEGGGAGELAEALLKLDGAHGVFAWRPKSPEDEARHRALAEKLGKRASWLGLVDDMLALVAACDVQCLPATDLTAKVDLPLVLLEGLRAGRPVLIADTPPINELKGHGVRTTEPTPGAIAAALSELLADPPKCSLPEQYDARRMAGAYEALYEELE